MNECNTSTKSSWQLQYTGVVHYEIKINIYKQHCLK